MNIRIYNGDKSSPISLQILIDRFADNGLAAAPIDQHEINESDAWMDETDLLVFTAGSVTEFKSTLGPEGIQRVKDFVHEQGGTYFGICAGGYFGAETIDFKGLTFQKRADGLGFFNVLARGALSDVAGVAYSGNADSAAVIDVFHDSSALKYKSLYWGGPQFLLKARNPLVKSFGRINSPDKRATYVMGVHGPVGTRGGYAFLLGHHPEINAAMLPRYFAKYSGGPGHDRRLLDQLEAAADMPDPFLILLKEIGQVQKAKGTARALTVEPA